MMLLVPHLFGQQECQGQLIEFSRDENWVCCSCDVCGTDFSFKPGEERVRRHPDERVESSSVFEAGF